MNKDDNTDDVSKNFSRFIGTGSDSGSGSKDELNSQTSFAIRSRAPSLSPNKNASAPALHVSTSGSKKQGEDSSVASFWNEKNNDTYWAKKRASEKLSARETLLHRSYETHLAREPFNRDQLDRSISSENAGRRTRYELIKLNADQRGSIREHQSLSISEQREQRKEARVLDEVGNRSKDRQRSWADTTQEDGATIRNNGRNTMETTLENDLKKAPFPSPNPISDGDGILFAESTDLPGVPIVFRSEKAKVINPERINLDKRSLTICPLLDGEHRVRLLNYQNNKIRCIDNMHGLPNLIYLDLYNNQVECIENLDAIPTLRVLMMGKNKIKRIENLQNLKKLDVLDLHSNQINIIENMDSLKELRVLNLAGNQIAKVEKLANLISLTELNLRRNLVEEVTSIASLPSLQRLLLSFNKISNFTSIHDIFQSRALSELCLENNPLTKQLDENYRYIIIQKLPQLKYLDQRTITDDERRQVYALSKREIEKKQQNERAEIQKAERFHAIKLTKTHWISKMESHQNDMSSIWSINTKKNEDATIVLKDSKNNDNDRVGFSEVEVCGEFRTLFIYGNASEALGSPRVQSFATGLVMKYISIESIPRIFEEYAFPQSYDKLDSIKFSHNNLTSLRQLSFLKELGPSIRKLHIIKNPLVTSSLLKDYIAAFFPNILEFNGKRFTEEDRMESKHMFHEYMNSQLPTKMAETSNKNHKLKVIVNKVVSTIIYYIDSIQIKLKMLDDKWPQHVDKLIQKSIEDRE